MDKQTPEQRHKNMQSVRSKESDIEGVKEDGNEDNI